jgi:uncharacterized protein (DUF983 family)
MSPGLTPQGIGPTRAGLKVGDNGLVAGRRFLRALRLHCPRCGSGGVVRRLRLAERCPRCRHGFERHEGYWLGAIAINTIATMGVFAVAFVTAMVLTWPDPPWTAITVGVVTLNTAFPVAFYPWSKTLWIALDLSMHPVEPGRR